MTLKTWPVITWIFILLSICFYVGLISLIGIYGIDGVHIGIKMALSTGGGACVVLAILVREHIV